MYTSESPAADAVVSPFFLLCKYTYTSELKNVFRECSLAQKLIELELTIHHQSTPTPTHHQHASTYHTSLTAIPTSANI